MMIISCAFFLSRQSFALPSVILANFSDLMIFRSSVSPSRLSLSISCSISCSVLTTLSIASVWAKNAWFFVLNSCRAMRSFSSIMLNVSFFTCTVSWRSWTCELSSARCWPMSSNSSWPFFILTSSSSLSFCRLSSFALSSATSARLSVSFILVSFSSSSKDTFRAFAAVMLLCRGITTSGSAIASFDGCLCSVLGGPPINPLSGSSGPLGGCCS
mmetsp:Transcript_29439/g.51689  ORF Transcript_29439/g.51689 Transcript_29439/m.51689 type:complete len:215 (+) Transcript_29439:1723-2367(+)